MSTATASVDGHASQSVRVAGRRAQIPRIEPSSKAERTAAGKATRAEVLRSSHGGWEPPPGRRDPVAVLEEQAQTRVPEPVPIRRLWDNKGSALVEAMDPRTMAKYAELCGWTLARAHARSGDPVAIAGYLGSGAAFDRALAAFAETYADQNERDYAALREASDAGRIEAEAGL